MRTVLILSTFAIIVGCQQEQTPAPSPQPTPQANPSYFILDGNGFTQDTFYTIWNSAEMDTANGTTSISLQDTANSIHQAFVVNRTGVGSGQISSGGIIANDTTLQFWFNPITLNQYTSTTISGTYGGYCLYFAFPYDTVNISGIFTANRH